MKIAICYSGNLRTYEHCVKNHFEIIGNADIYISTWDEITESNNINDPWHHKINLNLPKKTDINYINKVTPIGFNIKSIKIDNYRDFNFKSLKSDNHLSYQYFKIKDSYNLIENYIEKYDFIIRLRPDITIKEIAFDKNYILFNKYIWYNYEYKGNQNAINETLWISTPDLAKKTSSIYDNLEKINNSIKNIYGEAVCYKNLEIENILNKVKTFDFKYNVIR
jgi:hypothetical protein